MERYGKTHLRNVGYKALLEQGWTHQQIADADVNSIKTEILLDGAGNLRRVGLRVDSKWLENIGRHALGLEMVDSESWIVDMRG